MIFRTNEELARFAIEYYLINQKEPVVKKVDINNNLHRNGACFATIYVDNKLRGCIGDCEAYEPLYLNIIRNSIRAATIDYRFESISLSDLPNLKASVSVLTPPQIYKPKNRYDLLKFLETEKPGLIIEKNGRHALFLPQVWEELPKPEEFLTHLCMKAGLDPDEWQKKDMKFQIFRTE